MKDLSQTTQEKQPALVQQANHAATRDIDREELERQVAQCSGFVKMMTGVANNCAYLVACYAMDKVTDRRGKDTYVERPWQPHPRYKHKVKQTFKQFFADWSAMERRLRVPAGSDVRFFHVADMPENARKKYGAMTDAEYFEFWKGTGALAYQKSTPLVTSLQNKFRLSLERHGVPHAQQTAWAMTGDAALQLAVETWERTMRSCHEALPMLSQDFLDGLWRVFSPRRPADTWRRALLMLSPECDGYKLDSDEERNIALGLAQLRELWVSTDLPFDAVIGAVEDYDEDLFRTRGEAKKAIRELTEMRNEARQEIEQTRRKGRME